MVPHHKGRKRMHLELKETMSRVGTDIKQKVMDSLKATMGAVYSVAGTLTGQVEQAVESEMAEQVRPESPVQEEVLVLPAKINDGRRVDYVIQEAPLESFNEYLFAISSHLCYWESEDICLMVLKEIYSSMNITADSELLDRPVLYRKEDSPMMLPSQPVHRSTSDHVNLSNTAFPGPPQASSTLIPGPSPSLFSPDSLPSVPAPISKSNLSYARPSAIIPPQTTSIQAPPVMGMDPTAPITMDRPIAPPPTMGFSR